MWKDKGFRFLLIGLYIRSGWALVVHCFFLFHWLGRAQSIHMNFFTPIVSWVYCKVMGIVVVLNGKS